MSDRHRVELDELMSAVEAERDEAVARLEEARGSVIATQKDLERRLADANADVARLKAEVRRLTDEGPLTRQSHEREMAGLRDEVCLSCWSDLIPSPKCCYFL